MTLLAWVIAIGFFGAIGLSILATGASLVNSFALAFNWGSHEEPPKEVKRPKKDSLKTPSKKVQEISNFSEEYKLPEISWND